MTPHIFKLRLYESGISIEECICGAVKFGVNWFENTEEGECLLQRVKDLNRLFGKEGNPLDHQEKNQTDRAAGLPPVPPRPVLPPGASIITRNMAIRDYYEANKAVIIEEWEKNGKPKSLPRWKISQASLNGILKRWGIIAVEPKKKEKKTKTKVRARVTSPVPETMKLTVFPEFPAFQDSWKEAVQIKWLDVYSIVHVQKRVPAEVKREKVLK